MKINLVEEWKLYETMWDNMESKNVDLEEENNQIDPVQAELDKYGDIEIEYDGFDTEWYEDKWNYSRMDHDQDCGIDHYRAFTYSKEVGDIFELLRDTIIDKYIDKVPANEILTKYKELSNALDQSSPDTEDKIIEALELHIAKNLEEFLSIFYDYVADYYWEDAKEWALDHFEPV